MEIKEKPPDIKWYDKNISKKLNIPKKEIYKQILNLKNKK